MSNAPLTASAATTLSYGPGAPTVADWRNTGRHEHGTDSTVGYSVVRTSWTGSFVGVQRHEIARVDGAGRYSEALRLMHAERDRQRAAGEREMYAVIDCLHVCGCRGDEINSTDVG